MQAVNKFINPRFGRYAAYTGQSKNRFFCAFATQIVAQKIQHFACRL